MRSILSSCLLALTAKALAQTFIVDVNNGPGTNFTSIAAAVAAVPDGAVIRVRSGTYLEFTVGNKSLKLLADPGVVVTSAAPSPFPWLAVSGVQAGKSVVLRGFDIRPPLATASVQMAVTNCAGTVLLDQLRLGFGSAAWFLATNCGQLLVRDMTTQNSTLAFELTNCNTVAERCAAFPGFIGTAIEMNGGTLQLVDCAVAAGLPYPNLAPFAHAVAMQGGDLRLLGNTSLSSIAVTPPQPIVGGNGTVRYGGAVTIAAPMFAPGIVATALAMPAVATAYAAGQATATVTGAAGHLVALAVALPGPPVSLPGLDAIWLDGATFTPLGLGVLGATPFAVQMPWTPGAMPAVRAVFQALTFDPVAGFAISNPSLLLLP